MTRRTREADMRTRYEAAITQEETRIRDLERKRRGAGNAKSAVLIDVSIESRRRMLGVYRARLLELKVTDERVL